VPPTIRLTAPPPPSAAALVLPVAADGRPAAEIDLPGVGPAVIEHAVQLERWKGEAGEAVTIPLRDRLVVAVGVGSGSSQDARRAGAAAVRRLRNVTDAVAVLPPRSGGDVVGAFVEGFLLGGYRFTISKTERPETFRTLHLVVPRPPVVSRGFEYGLRVAEAVRLARDLAATPASTKTPAWLAREATRIARRSRLSVRVRDERELAAEGFGGILAVGSGSVHPPRLIELRYDPAEAAPGVDVLPGHVVLIGKGVTFDSGGLSLKTSANMVAMKTDMAGGGAVIAAMSALADLGARVTVTGLIPAAENMPSGSALRPSDVIRHYDGTTVEVLNTDAEGRLLLADAIGYAKANLAPDVIVDLATLTGAMSRGLGRRHAGLFSTDDRLAAVLLDAAAAAGEGLWRMPFVEEYRDALDSPIADLANVAVPEKEYGAAGIVAALFLREFAEGTRFAHLDIAGPARADADEYEIVKGPTGYGVRLLIRWLTTPDPLRGLRRSPARRAG
jgi:leucyl aminopeptidase